MTMSKELLFWVDKPRVGICRDGTLFLGQGVALADVIAREDKAYIAGLMEMAAEDWGKRWVRDVSGRPRIKNGRFTKQQALCTPKNTKAIMDYRLRCLAKRMFDLRRINTLADLGWQIEKTEWIKSCE